MTNLFDMLNAAGNGQAMQAMMRQYGLSQQQMQAAMEALLPAFSQGLKRSVADPYGMAALMQTFLSGANTQFFADPASAFSPKGIEAGNAILGQLFGSKELSRAVAAHAATATGLGQEIIKQMLPALAAVLMGGLANQTMSRAMSGGFGASGNVFGELIEQMMKQGGGMAAPQPEAPANPWGKMLEGMFGGGTSPLGDNPLGRMFEDMMKGGRREPAGDREDDAQAAGDNPLGRVFEEMMKGATGGPRTAKPRRPGPRSAPTEEQVPPRPKNPYDDLFGGMFEAGRKTRDDYQRGLESVFDTFLKGMDRKG